MAQRLIELKEMIDELERAVSCRSMWSYLRDFAAQVGYSHLLALKAVASTDHFVALRVLDADGAVAPSGAGAGTIATLADRHPIAWQTRLSREPFLISEISDFPTSASPCLIDTFSAQFKHSSVLVVPLAGQLGRAEAFFAFGGNNPDSGPMTRLLLQVASYAALGQSAIAPARQNGGTKRSLTQREAACLQMSSRGKTNEEICEAIGVTTRTIRRHLANAKRKLGVPKRVRAVGRAVQSGRDNDAN